MGVKCISVRLSGQKVVFNDGDVVEAIVDFDIGGRAEVYGIVATLKGQTKTQFTANRKEVKGAEHLVFAKQFLSASGTETEVEAFKHGSHSLPFSFKLPTTVASTVEGKFGYVRYWLEVEQPNFWLTKNAQTKHATLQLQVVQRIDVNSSTYLFPVRGKDSKIGGLLCFKSVPLFIEAKTDRAAYCASDIVSITTTFRNQSNKFVRPCVKLVQMWTFTAQEGEKSDNVSFKLEQSSDTDDAVQYFVDEEGRTTWSAVKYQLPADCVPTVGCEILQVSYYLEVGLDVSWASDLNAILPIVIGTIPFQDDDKIAVIQPSRWTGSGKKLSRTKSMLRHTDAARQASVPPPTCDVHQMTTVVDDLEDYHSVD